MTAQTTEKVPNPPWETSTTRQSDQKRVQHIGNDFPTLNETMDMAALSLFIYSFEPEPNDTAVCDLINNRRRHNRSNPLKRRSLFPISHLGLDVNVTLPADLQCHWYYHDRHGLGIQLMIVSSYQHEYVTVVFAGTDNLQTALLDANIWKASYGDGHDWTLPKPSSSFVSSKWDGEQINKHRNATESSYKRAKVHSGFNHAVFDHGLMDQILSRVQAIRHDFRRQQQQQHTKRLSHPFLQTDANELKIYTTGHSLGGAASVLTAVGLASYYDDQASSPRSNSLQPSKDIPQSSTTPTVTSLNFGCPCVGNRAWRTYLHDSTGLSTSSLAIWRVVLGWDLVPRLPELFYHVGHTIQCSGVPDPPPTTTNTSMPKRSLRNVVEDTTTESNFTGKVRAYYHHYGDKSLKYAPIPFGWNERPYLWVPGALSSHHMGRYWQFLDDLFTAHHEWISEFVPLQELNDDHPPNVDDDLYVNPPDDDFERS